MAQTSLVMVLFPKHPSFWAAKVFHYITFISDFCSPFCAGNIPFAKNTLAVLPCSGDPGCAFIQYACPDNSCKKCFIFVKSVNYFRETVVILLGATCRHVHVLWIVPLFSMHAQAIAAKNALFLSKV